MRRIWWGMPLLCLVACVQAVEKEPLFVMQVARPAVEGQVAINVQSKDVPDASFVLRLFQGETEVHTQAASTTPITFHADAGDYRARVELVQGSEVLDSMSADFRVFPTVPVERRIYRECPSLIALDDAAENVDCPISYEGVQPSYSYRSVHTSDGRMTWALEQGELVAHTARGDSNSVAFPDGDWLAASDIVLSQTAVARLWARTLTRYEFDSGGRPAPMAIASHDGRYGVLYGPAVAKDVLGIASPFSLCALAPYSTRWEVGACTTVNGVYLRQDALDGRVLFSTNGELTWFDLTDPEHPTVVRKLVSDERFVRGGSIFSDGSHDVVVVSRSENLDCVGLARADWSKRTLFGGRISEVQTSTHVSSELVWFTSPLAEETIWAPLP